MDYSSILRQHMQAERKMAISLDKGVKGVYEKAIDTTEVLYDGFERLSWRTSCFIDKYEDVCQEIKIEDERYVLGIWELFRKRDILLYMLTLYVEFVLDDEDRTQREVKSKARGTSKLFAGLVAGMLTKKAIAYTIGKSLSGSPEILASIRKHTYKKGTLALTAVTFYGQVQKAAMAARKLRMLEPRYYNILYINNIEMLYIYVDPIITGLIMKFKSKYNATLEEKIEILEGIINS
ncbi:hypothetical protein Z042_08950 [Chania multitudinisentens RB-25]|uniref:Uncharacterized protein n=1 Tax=Chania multitudinisentens RB-25 TaxID=1441930 RepID=W0LBU3_9GAMM|nr:hypothetical protein [Chania multitudinisentens]AHG19737.2 hypothetical protein Z042_08950 [Chania multitudinisentens RB-25]